MIQSVFGRCAASFVGGTNYLPLHATDTTTTVAQDEQIISAPGILRNFRMLLSAAPGVGTAWTFTLMVNNVDTAVVVTISGAAATSGTDLVNTATVVAGDLVKWRADRTGVPSGAMRAVNYDFQSTDDFTSIFCTGALGFTSTTPIFLPGLCSDSSTTSAALRTTVVPCAGVITGYRAYRQGSNGAGSFDLAIYKNGVKQDGAGGTTDTRASLPGSGVTNTVTASFSLSVAAGDLIYMQSDRNGATTSSTVSLCVTFKATEANTFPIATIGATLSTGTTPEFTDLIPFEGVGLSSSEVPSTIITPIEVVALYANLSAAPSAGKSRSIALRKNAGNSALTTTIADAATTGNDAHKVKFKRDDTICIREVAASTSTTAAIMSVSVAAKNDSSKGAGGGSGAGGNKKGGGGAISIQTTGGAGMVNFNPGVDIGITS